ncbi:hypothetical protein CFP56_036093 [Quercus suber]|uniref:Uncharacterized protein n=1 Tax=Quercus suber TaxID=58331 RepID=A0AAW0LQH4_QUESU
MVDLLIDQNTRTWNKGLINGLFVEEDAELIKRIPLSRVAKEDSLYCHTPHQVNTLEPVHAVWSVPELGEVWDVGEEWCFRSEVEFTDVKELLSWMIAEGVHVHYLAYARPFLSSLISPLDLLRCSTELVSSMFYSVGTRFENRLS